MASTRDMVFGVRQLVAYASTVMTLEPGDLIMTGTPAGVAPLVDGDVVEVAVEGIGALSNPVAAEEAH
jgi:2-keto-4-pentenoate hydratase/2-oxohepta-3-ene-1,7-dioic acid hydratase in catechol pathway